MITKSAACTGETAQCTVSDTTPISEMAKGGKQEVGHNYVRDKARATPGDYCNNLKNIMKQAKRDGNSKLFNDAKATWKQDCRGE